MKKKAYKLKDISYWSLSLTYIALILVALIFTLLMGAVQSMNKNWIGLILVLVFGGASIAFFYRIGTKYGEYGLVILMAKLVQPKQIKNDFPLLERQLLRSQMSDRPEKIETVRGQIANETNEHGRANQSLNHHSLITK